MKSKFCIIAVLLVSLAIIGCSRNIMTETPTYSDIAINSTRPSFDRIYLYWNYPDGFPTSNLSYYTLYKSTTANFALTVANQVSPNVSANVNLYEDTDVVANTTYYYRIAYLNDTTYQYQDISEEVSVTTIQKSDISVNLSIVSANIPTLSIAVINYPPTMSVGVYRATGNLTSVPTATAELIFTADMYTSTNVSFADIFPTPSASTSYSYQVYGDLTDSSWITSNVVTHNYP